MNQIPQYAIGSDTLPGLAKLVEEIGELQQVLGKIIALGHAGDHWDGSNLTEKLVEEIADAEAALNFFRQQNLRTRSADIQRRMQNKLVRFHTWHMEAVDTGGLEPVKKETL